MALERICMENGQFCVINAKSDPNVRRVGHEPPSGRTIDRYESVFGRFCFC